MRANKRITTIDEPPRTMDEIEEKKYEHLIEPPDDLHDAEGRPISLAVEIADEAKLSAFVAGARKEFTSLRCSDCRCGHGPKDHIVTGETEFCGPCLVAAGHLYEPRGER